MAVSMECRCYRGRALKLGDRRGTLFLMKPHASSADGAGRDERGTHAGTIERHEVPKVARDDREVEPAPLVQKAPVPILTTTDVALRKDSRTLGRF